MYRKIIVPLDGSELAECALSYAEELAKCCKSEEIILVTSTEQVKGKTNAPEAKEIFEKSDRLGYYKVGAEIIVKMGKLEKEGKNYLSKIAKKMEGKGFKVRTEVLYWPPAETIVSFAEHSDADLIIMSSHGRSGISKWAHGSVAEKVLRLSCIPVMLVRVPGCVPGF